MRPNPNYTVRTETFVSAKAARPIPHPGGLVHDALVQCSLDPSVLAIDFLHPEGTASPRLADLGVVSILRRDGAFFLDIVPARPQRSLRDHDVFTAAMAGLGLRPLTFEGHDIMREPRFGSSRAVWRHRGYRTDIETRYRVVRALEGEAAIGLDELCTIVGGPRDPLLSVLSMACADLVEIDIEHHPIGPRTQVRSRS